MIIMKLGYEDQLNLSWLESNCTRMRRIQAFTTHTVSSTNGRGFTQSVNQSHAVREQLEVNTINFVYSTVRSAIFAKRSW